MMMSFTDGELSLIRDSLLSAAEQFRQAELRDAGSRYVCGQRTSERYREMRRVALSLATRILIAGVE